MSHNDKQKFPCEDALPVAREICRLLKPVAERLIVAGSLRRRKTMVGDVEILFVPKFEERPFDLISTRPVNLAEELLCRVLEEKILTRRPNVDGKFAWGAVSKLAVHVASGIPVDLFTATEANWWNYLVCRTGPPDSNLRICNAAQARGWKWKPYSEGFCKLEQGLETGEMHAVQSEREVFEFVGLPYQEPWERR